MTLGRNCKGEQPEQLAAFTMYICAFVLLPFSFETDPLRFTHSVSHIPARKRERQWFARKLCSNSRQGVGMQHVTHHQQHSQVTSPYVHQRFAPFVVFLHEILHLVLETVQQTAERAMSSCSTAPGPGVLRDVARQRRCVGHNALDEVASDVAVRNAAVRGSRPELGCGTVMMAIGGGVKRLVRKGYAGGGMT